MEKENKQNNFNNPVVIILLVVLLGLGGYVIFSKNNPQPTQENQIFQQTVDNSQNSQPAAPPKEPAKNNTTKSTSEIIQEWRKSTAYVICFYGNAQSGTFRSVSGSGLLVGLNSKSMIITNRHVANNPLRDLDYCDVKFPGQTGVSYMIEKENISYDNNGNDVSFLGTTYYPVEFEKKTRGDQYSLAERTQKGSYLCQEPEKIGDSVVIIGYPSYGSSVYNFTYGYPIEVTATDGIISGKDGIYYTTSAKIDSGNSGGLALDAQNDCYFGIPTWNESGNFESLGRILPAFTFLHY